MTVPADITYPAIATNAAWQKKKSFIDKSKSSTKTGLGAALIDAEAKWKLIPWAKMDASKLSWANVKQAQQRLADAKAAHEKVVAAKNSVLAAKKQAAATAINKALSKPAQTAAAAIEVELQKAQDRLDKVDLKDIESLVQKAEAATNLPDLVPLIVITVKMDGQRLAYTAGQGGGSWYRDTHTVRATKLKWNDGLKPESLVGKQVSIEAGLGIKLTPDQATVHSEEFRQTMTLERITPQYAEFKGAAS
jgi:beta-glucosidase-like glycosyl hydrolase